jgi:hypothetical protein
MIQRQGATDAMDPSQGGPLYPFASKERLNPPHLLLHQVITVNTNLFDLANQLASAHGNMSVRRN